MFTYSGFHMWFIVDADHVLGYLRYVEVGSAADV
jgi:hypothetical protein